MRTIFKYKLPPTDYQVLALPQGAKVLCVQVQYELPCLWVELPDAHAPVEQRVFLTLGTGNPIPEDAVLSHYIGTYQIHGGTLVFHVYESIEVR